MNSKKKRNIKPLPISVINEAASGDMDAMQKVLKHYKGYIHTLSIVKTYDGSGKLHLLLDETLKSELEVTLIMKVMDFKLTG